MNAKASLSTDAKDEQCADRTATIDRTQIAACCKKRKKSADLQGGVQALREMLAHASYSRCIMMLQLMLQRMLADASCVLRKPFDVYIIYARIMRA